jgi:hypothetical protein
MGFSLTKTISKGTYYTCLYGFWYELRYQFIIVGISKKKCVCILINSSNGVLFD